MRLTEQSVLVFINLLSFPLHFHSATGTVQHIYFVSQYFSISIVSSVQC